MELPGPDQHPSGGHQRAHVRNGTGDTAGLVGAVSSALFEADPIGINFKTNTDEYDTEAEAIVDALPGVTGPEDVQVLTHEVFVHWFDAATAGPSERYQAVAEQIWTLWRRYLG